MAAANIRGIFQQGALAIRQAFGNVFEPCDVLITRDRPDYDPDSGTPLWHDVPPISGILIAFVGFSARERAESEVPYDIDRALVAAVDAPSWRPKAGDMIRRSTTPQVHTVVNVQNTGGVDALWDMQTRQSHIEWPF
jgi:hypothetical protein